MIECKNCLDNILGELHEKRVEANWDLNFLMMKHLPILIKCFEEYMEKALQEQDEKNEKKNEENECLCMEYDVWGAKTALVFFIESSLCHAIEQRNLKTRLYNEKKNIYKKNIKFLLIIHDD